jgi:hypothetical protein
MQMKCRPLLQLVEVPLNDKIPRLMRVMLVLLMLLQR